MAKEKFNISIRLRPSRQVAAFLLLLYGAALLALVLIHIAWWVNLLGGCLVVLGFAASFQHSVMHKAPHSVVGLEVGEGAHWRLTLRSGEVKKAHLQGPSSVVTNMLLVLNFKVMPESGPAKPGSAKQRGKSHYSVLICPDMVDQATFRRLKLWLSQVKG